MTDQGPRRGSDAGDTLREGVRAVTGILGAFKDAMEQTFNDMSERGDISPERAKEASRDAMKRAQEAMDDVRGRLDFVPRREFDALKTELAELRAQVERHAAANVHHSHTGAAGASGGAGAGGSGSNAGTGSAPGIGGAPGTSSAPGTGGTGAGSAGSGMGDGSPGL